MRVDSLADGLFKTLQSALFALFDRNSQRMCAYLVQDREQIAELHKASYIRRIAGLRADCTVDFVATDKIRDRFAIADKRRYNEL